ncbi:MAG: hypothetical protein WB682_09960 [Candidatus Dormiibacterota bacterium]
MPLSVRTLVKGASERRSVLVRLDPAVHDAIIRWAQDELRSSNAQIEFLLRRALVDDGRLPSALRVKRAARGNHARSSPRKRAG